MAPPRGPEQPSPTAGETERQLCDMLSSTAKLRVEDVQGGVAIVLSPKQGQDLATLRDEAHRMESMMRQRPGEGGGGCGLLAIGRLPSVTGSISEGQKEVRLVLHTANPAEVKDLRRAAHQEVRSLSQPRP
jgi:hypothetical protein